MTYRPLLVHCHMHVVRLQVPQRKPQQRAGEHGEVGTQPDGGGNGGQ